MEYKQIFNRLLIFDGSHCLHRNLSVPNNWEMQTSTGIRTGGVFGVLRTLLKEINLYNYYPVVVFDNGLSERRLQLYPNYKHTQEKQEKKLLTESKEYKTEEEKLEEEFLYEYNTQREMLKQLLPYFNIPVICHENWEGDDLIYLLTKLSKNSIVISDDKDLLQLIREDNTGKCRVKRAMRDEFWDLDKLKEESFDVNNYIVNKAIVGDPSDNIPSACYGVGEKTAPSLYKFYSYLTENNIKYPFTEEELDTVCKQYKLTKRKAYINFNENQFLTNIMLTDLSLVDNDIVGTNILNMIIQDINFFFENIFDENMQKDSILKIFDYLEIKTFNFNELFLKIQQLKDVIYNEEPNIEEIIQIKKSSLFEI